MNVINLHRLNNDSNIDTVFLIGNGAIEGGNSTLAQALKKAKNEGFFHHDVDQVDAISSLAMVSCYERQMFDGLMLLLKNKFSSEKTMTFTKYTNNLFGFIHLRNLIATEFKKNKNLCIRKNILSYLLKQGIYSSSSVTITTNWDDTLSNNEQIENLAYIHGHIDFPLSLVFPMQAIGERVLQAVILDELTKKTVHQYIEGPYTLNAVSEIYKFYDVNDSDSLIAKMHDVKNRSITFLQEAKRIIIAGFAFNNYDNELAAAIAGIQFSNLSEVVIINKIFSKDKSSQLEEKERMIRTVQGLFKCTREQILFIDSENPSLCDDFNAQISTPSSQLSI